MAKRWAPLYAEDGATATVCARIAWAEVAWAVTIRGEPDSIAVLRTLPARRLSRRHGRHGANGRTYPGATGVQQGPRPASRPRRLVAREGIDPCRGTLGRCGEIARRADARDGNGRCTGSRPGAAVRRTPRRAHAGPPRCHRF